jgi:hypothetical protein
MIGRIALAAVLAAGAVLALGGAAADSLFPLRALRWTDRGAWIEAMTRQPRECLALPAGPAGPVGPAGLAGLAGPARPAERAAVEVGRAAFRSPLVLGGQAARLGLSCESCHTNGRRNAAFRFEGLSGTPGTADVTSSMMSTHRGNGVFDPKPIPDLAAPGKVSRSAISPALSTFIHGLITEEFDGREPPPAVLDGLVAYVRAIGAGHCVGSDPEPLTAALWIDDANRAMAAAHERWLARDAEGSVVMLGAARHALGRLDERYATLAQDRANLVGAARAIARIREAVETGHGQPERLMVAWSAQARPWQARLRHDEPRSLFDRARLTQAIGLARHR